MAQYCMQNILYTKTYMYVESQKKRMVLKIFKKMLSEIFPSSMKTMNQDPKITIKRKKRNKHKGSHIKVHNSQIEENQL